MVPSYQAVRLPCGLHRRLSSRRRGLIRWRAWSVLVLRLPTFSDAPGLSCGHVHVPEEVTLTVSVSKKFVYRQRCRRGRTLSTDMFRHGVDEGSHGAKARKMSVIHLDNGGGGPLSGGGVTHCMCTELKILFLASGQQRLKRRRLCENRPIARGNTNT